MLPPYTQATKKLAQANKKCGVQKFTGSTSSKLNPFSSKEKLAGQARQHYNDHVLPLRQAVQEMEALGAAACQDGAYSEAVAKLEKLREANPDLALDDLPEVLQTAISNGADGAIVRVRARASCLRTPTFTYTLDCSLGSSPVGHWLRNVCCPTDH